LLSKRKANNANAAIIAAITKRSNFISITFIKQNNLEKLQFFITKNGEGRVEIFVEAGNHWGTEELRASP
jgi:sensor histidine kinase YesM